MTIISAPPIHLTSTRGFCFRQIKDFLRRHQLLAEHETKIAIAEAVLRIFPQNSLSFPALWVHFIALI